MEILQDILRESVNGGFWKFIGYWILIYLFMSIPAKTLAFIINRPLRHWNINKHGYPPAHCDADGDFKTND